MSTPIAFNLDVYGGYARSSALADYVEIAAICGETITRAGLADRLVDSGGLRRMDEMFVGREPGEDEPDEDQDETNATADGPGVDAASKVFDLLAERSEVLGLMYPFEISENDLALRKDVEVADSMYIALLTLTLAHANKIACAHDPKQVLEATVARALAATGITALDLGALSRRPGKDFRETLKDAAELVGLQASPYAAITLKHANEEGVDCLGHLVASTPRRAGAWVFLGQVTCGASETWEGKMDQPKPGTWRKLLNTGVLPQVFLAVPHHVDSVHLEKLLDGDRLVLDRLRLVALAGEPSSEERSINDTVVTTGVEAIV